MGNTRILVVDDEASILAVMQAALVSDGHKVEAVRQSDRAAELIKNKEFDLMITDMRMHPLNGLELLKLARQEKPKMNVIMVTAYYTEQKAKEALKNGAFDYIAKPFDIQHLLNRVREGIEANPPADK